jgi:protein TonB
MFENSPSWQRWSAPREKVIRGNLGYVPYVEDEGDRDRRRLTITVVVAIALHVLAFVLIRVPARDEVPELVAEPQRVLFTFAEVRYAPPPPQTEQRAVPKTRRRTIPIPDATPDEPEPLPIAELEVPDIEIADLVFGIPEAPPSARTGSGWTGSEPLQVGGDVSPPVKIYSPTPKYTEGARKGRVQGVVILQAIIDSVGNVDQVAVLKGLPQGLSESAIATVKEWKFRPARKAGSPVPVYFNLTVTFSLQ